MMKLCYLLDRLSLDRRGIAVVGGDYLSMRNGPVTSGFLDLISAEPLRRAAAWFKGVIRVIDAVNMP